MPETETHSNPTLVATYDPNEPLVLQEKNHQRYSVTPHNASMFKGPATAEAKPPSKLVLFVKNLFKKI